MADIDYQPNMNTTAKSNDILIENELVHGDDLNRLEEALIQKEKVLLKAFHF